MNSLSIEKEELMTEARKLRDSINDLCGDCPLYKTILCNESIADMLDDCPAYLKDRLWLISVLPSIAVLPISYIHLTNEKFFKNNYENHKLEKIPQN